MVRLLKTDTLDQVQEKLSQYFQHENVSSETVQLLKSVDRYIARDIFTDMDMPQFRRSVVDGYAVIAADTFGTGESIPSFLKVIGEVNMGEATDLCVKPGQAVYVPTGGMIPEGADGMVMIEYVEVLDEKNIAIHKPATPNGYIMQVGDDFSAGQLIFAKGHRLTAKDMGMLATCGMDYVEAFAKPKMAILSTGDEIIPIDQTPRPGQIRDINSYSIAALAEAAGIEITTISLCKDHFEQLQEYCTRLIKENDILILSGGSSAGAKDMTADLIESLGTPGVLTHGIAIKPGKPTVIGVIDRKDPQEWQECFQGTQKLQEPQKFQDNQQDLQKKNPKETQKCKQENPALAIGLPGHPMSAIVVYKTVVEPFIKRHYFHNTEAPLTITAEITENVHSGEGRETYQLVKLERIAQCSSSKEQELKRDYAGIKSNDEDQRKDSNKFINWKAIPLHGKSGSISLLKDADGYIRIPSLSEGVAGGQPVEVILL